MKKQLLKVVLCLFVSPLWAQYANELSVARQLSDQGQYQASTTLLSDYIATHPNRFYDQADAYFLISFNYMQLGDFAAALEANKESIDLRGKLRLDNVAENHLRAGAIYQMQGFNERAMAEFIEAQELPAENASLYALIHTYLGLGLQESEKYEAAERYYQLAQEILEIELGPNSADMADNYYRQGFLYLKQGKTTMARAPLERCLSAAQALNRYDLIARANRLLAATYTFQDAQARNYYRQALTALTQAYSGDHPEVVLTRLELAAWLMVRHGRDEARGEIDAAFISLGLSTSRTQPQESTGTPLLPVLHSQAYELRARAELYSPMADATRLEHALLDVKSAMALNRRQWLALSAYSDHSALLHQAERIADTGMALALRLYAQKNDAAHANEAFMLAEQVKRLRQRNERYAAGALAQRFPQLHSRDEAIRQSIRNAEAGLAAQPGSAAARRQVQEVRQQQTNFMAEARTRYPDYYDAVFDAEVTTLPQLQGSTPAKTVVLSYFVGEAHYYVFAVAQSGFLAIAQPLFAGEYLAAGRRIFDAQQRTYSTPEAMAAPLRSDLQAFMAAIRASDDIGVGEQGHRLHEKLIAPAKDFLKGATNLTIVPCEELYALPFGALVETYKAGGKAGGFERLSYLAKRYTLTYQPTATTLPSRSVPADAPQDFLGMAPVFDQSKPTGYLWPGHRYLFDIQYQSNEQYKATAGDGRTIAPLPESPQLLMGWADKFKKKRMDEIAFRYEEASEDAFKGRAGNYRYLHLVTHQFNNKQHPANTGLALAQPAASGGREDGILFAPEIYRLPLKADLVVLHGGHQTQGLPLNEGGIFTLSDAFLSAGAKQVLSTLWKVSDDKADALMSALYDELLKGQNPEIALQKAQRKLMGNRATANPLMWAGFALTAKA